MNVKITGRAVWIVGTQVVLLSLVSLSWLWLSEAKAAFIDTKVNEQECRRLIAGIGTLQSMGAIASENRAETNLSNAQLIQIADECGIEENQVASLQRKPPVKIEGSDYARQDLAVAFRHVSLQQLLTFAICFEKETESIKTSAINLTSSRSRERRIAGVKPNRSDAVKHQAEVGPDQWNAELILTQLVYVATSAAR